jgi:hypothetical protein
VRDAQQTAMDAQEYLDVLRYLARVRSEYLAAKDTVRTLERQLRNAKSRMKEATQRLASAEMGLTRRFG